MQQDERNPTGPTDDPTTRPSQERGANAPTGVTPPLFGTRESAAGLPYAVGDDEAHLSGLGPPPAHRLATPGRRFAARIIDILAVGVVLVVLQSVMWIALLFNDPKLNRVYLAYADDPTNQSLQELQEAMLPWAMASMLLTAIVWFCYEVPLTAMRGQTLGKLAVGIAVVGTGSTDPSRAAGKLGWPAAALRWAIVAAPIVLLQAFGLLVTALDCGRLLADVTERRCLHDRPAKTYVVQAGNPGNTSGVGR